MENQETVFNDDINFHKLGPNFMSTRHRDAVSPPNIEDTPRVGRRESEPHSIEINYLYDVLKTNFQNDRVMWDLNHYFDSEFGEINIQYDVSFFKNTKIPETLSSYDAKKYNNRPPDFAINILSKHTWKNDIGINYDKSRMIKTPVYLIFPSYHVTSKYYKPPFMRIYLLQENEEYKMIELREIAFIEDGEGKIIEKNTDAIVDISHRLPFRLALLKRKQKHDGGLPLFRIVLIKLKSFEIFQTTAELERERTKIAENKLQQTKNKLQQTKNKLQQTERENKKLKKKLAELKKN